METKNENAAPLKVSMTTLGCARNDVDSSELTGRLAANGWELVDDPDVADVALVNTCGFIEQAKQDSIDTIFELTPEDDEDGPAVVAIGCMAERYGKDLAQELPEVAAVLGFDSYEDMSSNLRAIVNGAKPEAHTPSDRRKLLPLAPADRATEPLPAEYVIERELDGNPCQPVKLASGCDRRCTFCAIPTFRGAYVSRSPAQVLAEVRWLAERDVKEAFLVSENTSSYGKDLGDIRLLEKLLPELAEVPGMDRIRVSYLQPAEIRPGLIETIATTDGVAPYYDISFQHASATLLRRMKRFGSIEQFLGLIQQIRALNPAAGIRSNFIVGFPGETDEEFADLERFVSEARLDVAGVFEYSDEDGTEAADMPGKVDPDVVAERAEIIRRIAETVTEERALQRVGEVVRVLVDEVGDQGTWGRAEHQGPESDGAVELVDAQGEPIDAAIGQIITATVVDAMGADLTAAVQQ